VTFITGGCANEAYGKNLYNGFFGFDHRCPTKDEYACSNDEDMQKLQEITAVPWHRQKDSKHGSILRILRNSKMSRSKGMTLFTLAKQADALTAT